MLRQTPRPTFSIRAISNPEPLAVRLRKLGFEVDVRENRELEIVADHPITAEELWEQVRESGVQVSSLVRMQLPLDEVFVNVVREVRDAGA